MESKTQSNLNKYAAGNIVINIRRGYKFKIVDIYTEGSTLYYQMYRYGDGIHFKIICEELDKKEYIILSLKSILALL